MPCCVDERAGARNGPAAIERFEAAHDAGEIFGDRQITAGQLLQGAYAVLPVVDRREQSAAEKFCQLSRINPIVLVPGFQEGILSRRSEEHTSELQSRQ